MPEDPITFDASAVNAVDYAVGPIMTNEQPVVIESKRWGRVKTLYR